MRTRIMLFLVAALALMWLSASASLSATYIHKWTAFPNDGKIKVAASNAYLAEVAREIGGDRVSVISLTKADQDARNPKLYKSMVKAVAEAALLLRVDKDYDPWIEELVQRARSAGCLDVGRSRIGLDRHTVKSRQHSRGARVAPGKILPRNNFGPPIQDRFIARPAPAINQ